ncbi:MAG: sulfite exporter TauE/SafE family protein [Mycobacteriaceae bacterium]|nr:sulfite exporter TauE/SafE family protein [Mycobacteriaceae bacterium]
MTVWELVAVVVAGVAAGTINTVVGSGSLITFPTLVALGVPPIVANVSNNIGLVPGSATGAYGYRAELSGQQRATRRLLPASALGALVGAALLISMPSGAFDVIVIVLIAVALVLVVVQPRLAVAVARRRDGDDGGPGAGLIAAVFGAGVYGGYFGAAQGVILLALLGIFLHSGGAGTALQRANGIKNVLALTVNAVAGVFFLVFAHDQIQWSAVAAIAAGASVGGVLGAKVGRMLPPAPLRAVIVVVGLLAIAKLATQ